jgi:hypothetical protein
MLLCLDGHELMSVLARNLCLCWPGTYVCVGQEELMYLCWQCVLYCSRNEPSLCQTFLSNIAPEMSQVYVKHFCHKLLQKWTKFLSNISVIKCSRNTRLLQLQYMFSSSQIGDTTPVASTLNIMPYIIDSSWNIDSLQQHQLILAHITDRS